MDSLGLHKLMREAGVDQDVIQAACQKNNELVKAEQDRRREEARKRRLKQQVEARVAAERDEAAEHLLASKPKLVRYSDEEGDGRRVDFGKCELPIQNRTLAELRQEAEETVVNALLHEFTGGWQWSGMELELEPIVRERWPREISRAARRIEKMAARAALRNLMDAIKCDAGISLTLISKDKVLARVSEAYDQLVVKSVDES